MKGTFAGTIVYPERVVWLALAVFLNTAVVLNAQPLPHGAQVLTYLSDIDDSNQPFAVYVPRNFDPAQRYPLVISLHAEGSNHRLNLRRVLGRGNRADEGLAQATRNFPPWPDVNYLIASPFARGTMGYRGLAEADVFAVLEEMKRRYPVDEDRVYLTGISMGGGGGLWYVLTRPDVWAAVALVCPAPPDDSQSYAANALHLPIHLFHGSRDPVVPVSVSRAWQKTLLDAGGRVEYLEYPNVLHNSWDPAYADTKVFRWFDQFRRNRFPDRVRFSSPAYKYAGAYWVKFDALTPGTVASVDARFTAPNQLVFVTGGALRGFSLNLTSHPSFRVGQPLRVEIDKTVLAIKRPGARLAFNRAPSGTWREGEAVLATGEKRPGAEGPLSEAFAGSHIYVYGTHGSPSPEEMLRRQAIARSAADWDAMGARPAYSPRILADMQVRETDLASASLILFGTAATNSLIARFASRAPVALKEGAADYGLTYVVPIATPGNTATLGRYAVVNSGLPWWTGVDNINRPGQPFVPQPYRLIESFGDYILFKGSLSNVIAEGRFDLHWKLSAEARKAMLATGAVEIP